MKRPFKISLAEWSLHRAMQEGQLRHDQFPQVAREQYGVEAIELVNRLFKDQANHKSLAEFKKRADDQGLPILVIMCDEEGDLGDPSEAARKQTVENHYRWVEAAKVLGCHSIRANARLNGDYEVLLDRTAESLRGLCEFAATLGINVLVENHGGLSSNGGWLAALVRKIGLPNCGTLPDFGNFRISEGVEYDRYQGVAELMPSAKAVSAKSRDFDAEGNETRVDYRRMMKIVLDAGYRGYVGIEYIGKNVGEPEGIRATKALLERVGQEICASPGS